MSIADTDSSFSSEEKSLFRPFTRESLRAIEQRIAEDHAKQKELEEKRAEGEVSLFELWPNLPESIPMFPSLNFNPTTIFLEA